MSTNAKEHETILKRICDTYGIGVHTYNAANPTAIPASFRDCAELTAFAYKGQAGRKVYLKDDPCLTPLERQYIWAHEIGHHLLGHLDRLPREEQLGMDEIAADTFASAIIAGLVLREATKEEAVGDERIAKTNDGEEAVGTAAIQV